MSDLNNSKVICKGKYVSSLNNKVIYLHDKSKGTDNIVWILISIYFLTPSVILLKF